MKYRDQTLSAFFSTEISPDSSQPPPKPGYRAPRTAAELLEVLDLVREGLSLSRACDRLGLRRATVKHALDSDPELSQLYMVATQERADYYAERALDIGLATYAGQGQPDRARVALDAIKWFVGAANPKKYRENYREPVDETVRQLVDTLTDSDRARAIATLIARKKAQDKLEQPVIEGYANTQDQASGAVQARDALRAALDARGVYAQGHPVGEPAEAVKAEAESAPEGED